MTKERNIFGILSILDRKNKAMTSGEITKELHNRGILLTDRGTRYYLKLLDSWGFTRNLGREGRIITQAGRDELKKTHVHARINFILDKIVRMASQTNFDVNRQSGTVVVNLSFIQENKERDALSILKKICTKSSLAPPFIKIAYPGERLCDFKIQEGVIGLATICSVTIDGILLNNKLYINPLYGGLVEFINQKAHRFTNLLLYGGSSFDPLDLFISRRMGTVYNAVVKNHGEVLADYREVHCIFQEKAIEILKKTVNVLGGLIIIGKPGNIVLGLPSNENYFGVVGFGGELLLSALEERGIQTNTRTVDAVINFRELEPIFKVKGEVLEL